MKEVAAGPAPVIPDGLGVLAVALALVPGWFYLRLRNKHRPPSAATGLGELLEVLAIGLLTTGVSCLGLVLIPHRWVPWLIDVDAFAASGTAYLRENIQSAFLSGAAVLVVAALTAWLLDLVEGTTSSDTFDSESSVWGQALGLRPEHAVPWVGIRLRSGELVEGVLHSLSFGHEGRDERDIALARPIRVTDPDQTTPRAVEIDRIVVAAAEIEYINVMHLPERSDRTSK